MKHRIDPKIDCVFKALLGSEENRNLLLHFLNKERNYHEYQARQNYLREQRAIQHAMEQNLHDLQQTHQDLQQTRQDLQQTRHELEEARRREQAMQEENERLRALLAQK
jgi:chromosome segregation ATPase